MSIPGSALAILGAASGGDTGYQISRSLRFNEPHSAYLSRSPGGGNRKKWTLSFWYKPALQDTSDRRCILEARNSSGHHSVINFRSTDDKFEIYHYTTSLQFQVLTTAQFRDPSAWYNFCIAYDTDQSGADKVKIFCNGIRITQFDNPSYPSDSYGDALWNDNNTPHTIGKHDSQYLSGYLAEYHWLDGIAPGTSTDDASGSVTGTPSAEYLTDFGEFSTTGVWNPIEYTGSYGNQGYYLDFSDNSSDAALGYDANATTRYVSDVTGTNISSTVKNLFDGNTALSCDGTAGTTITFTPSTPIPYSSSVECYTASSLTERTYSLNGGTGVTNVGNGWTTLATGSGTITSITNTPNANYSQAWSAIRVDGVILVEPNDWTVNNFVASADAGVSITSIKFDVQSNSGGQIRVFYIGSTAVTSSVYATATNNIGQYDSGMGSGDFPSAHDGSESTSLDWKYGDITYTFTNKSAAYVEFIGNMTNGTVQVNGTTYTPVASGTSAGNRTIYRITLVDSADIDCLLDSPTNYDDGTNIGGNYATLNPLNPRTNTTYSNGNLQLASAANYRSGVATIGITSGKFYFEGEILTASDNGYSMIGITTLPNYFNYSGANGDDDGFGWYSGTGQLYFNNAGGATYSSWTVGDIVSVAYDSATRRTWIAKNGTWQNSGDPAAGTGYVHTSSGTLPVYFSIATGTNGVVAANFGQRSFAHTPPTGFVALCTQNLSDPLIADGSTVFDVDPYQGTGNTHERSNFSFSPDFLWVKARAGTASPGSQNHYLVDSVRGANGTVTKKLSSNTTGEENAGQTDANNGIDLQSDGFELTTGDDGTNNANNTYVAWAWDAGTNSSKTYTVTVVSDSGNKYRFDGYGTSAVTLDLEEGSTYVFDQSDSSNATHPLRFATAADAAGGTEYTTGVTVTGTPGQAGAKTTITVASGAPTLYYYCSSHTGMGGQANTNSTAGASNFNGSIQTKVRANPSAGFSIVTYSSSNAGVQTVGHGLNAIPELVLTKQRNGASNWTVYHKGGTSFDKLLYLNAGNSTVNVSNLWGSSSNWTTTTFGINTGSNQAGDQVAYCFAPVAGYSAFGSYTGNGLTDGPFVFTGFRPALIITKRTDSTGGWVLWDTTRNPHNAALLELYPDDPSAEYSGGGIDILSNGFKLRNTSAHENNSGGSYVYAAFAEHPFKYARAR